MQTDDTKAAMTVDHVDGEKAQRAVNSMDPGQASGESDLGKSFWRRQQSGRARHGSSLKVKHRQKLRIHPTCRLQPA
jgi:hypothetical protein